MRFRQRFILTPVKVQLECLLSAWSQPPEGPHKQGPQITEFLGDLPEVSHRFLALTNFEIEKNLRKHMITHEMLKDQIDLLPEKYLPIVYRVIQALNPRTTTLANEQRESWEEFLENNYGIFSGDTVETDAEIPLEQNRT